MLKMPEVGPLAERKLTAVDPASDVSRARRGRAIQPQLPGSWNLAMRYRGESLAVIHASSRRHPPVQRRIHAENRRATESEKAATLRGRLEAVER